MATILERVQKIIADKFGKEEGEAITLSTDFVVDLQADSLDLVEIMMAFEEEFGTDGKKLDITDDDAEKIQTVQDLFNYLESRGIRD